MPSPNRETRPDRSPSPATGIGRPHLDALSRRPARKVIGELRADARSGALGTVAARELGVQRGSGLVAGLSHGARAVFLGLMIAFPLATIGGMGAVGWSLFAGAALLVALLIVALDPLSPWSAPSPWRVSARVVAMARENDADVVPRGDVDDLPDPVWSPRWVCVRDVVRWPADGRRVEIGSPVGETLPGVGPVESGYLAVEVGMDAGHVVLAPGGQDGGVPRMPLEGPCDDYTIDAIDDAGLATARRLIDDDTAALIVGSPYRMSAEVVDGWFVVHRDGVAIGDDKELWRRLLAVADRVVTRLGRADEPGVVERLRSVTGDVPGDVTEVDEDGRR